MRVIHLNCFHLKDNILKVLKERALSETDAVTYHEVHGENDSADERQKHFDPCFSSRPESAGVEYV